MKKSVNKNIERKRKEIARKHFEIREKQVAFLRQFALPYRRLICELLLQSDFDVQCFITGDIVKLARRFNYTVEHLRLLLDEMEKLDYISVHENPIVSGYYVIILNDDIEKGYFSIK